MTDDTQDGEAESLEEYVVFDDSTKLSLTAEAAISSFDHETLNDIGVIETETERVDGKTVVTECRLNPVYLALMASEFNTVEKSLGERFSRSRWRAESRLRF